MHDNDIIVRGDGRRRLRHWVSPPKKKPKKLTKHSSNVLKNINYFSTLFLWRAKTIKSHTKNPLHNFTLKSTPLIKKVNSAPQKVPHGFVVAKTIKPPLPPKKASLPQKKKLTLPLVRPREDTIVWLRTLEKLHNNYRCSLKKFIRYSKI